MNTRYTFFVTGNVVYDNITTTLIFKVKSTTKVNRMIGILCESINKDISQIKSCIIWSQCMTRSEYHYIDVNDTDITFRDLSIVGKKSITLTVNLDNFL